MGGLGARLALAAAATIAAVSLAEVALRLFVPLPSTVVWRQFADVASNQHGVVAEDIFASDPELFWRLAPNITRADDDWPLFGTISNAQGLREDHEIPRRKREGEVRILFLGDSCTFGDRLSIEESYVQGVEERLRTRFPGSAIECINAGVPGYTLFQGWRFLETEGFEYDPDVVVLYFGWNDGVSWGDKSDQEHYEAMRARQPPGPLRWSRMCQLLWQAMASVGAEEQSATPPAALRPRLLPQEFGDLLARVHESTDRRERELLLLVGPHRNNIATNSPRALRSPYQKVVYEYGANITFAGERAPGYVDLVPAVQKMAESHSAAALFLDSVHPTALTNRRIADLVADRLEPWLQTQLGVTALAVSPPEETGDRAAASVETSWESLTGDGWSALEAENNELAKRSFVVALDIAGTFAAGDSRLPASLNNLGLVHYVEDEYDEAESLFQRAISIQQETLGADHPDVARSLNNLGLLYYDQDRYVETEEAYVRALAITEKALGPDHPLVATGLHNMAGLYRAQGMNREAEPLYVRALDIRNKALGSDHADLAPVLNSLALLYADQGRLGEAETAFGRSLAIYEKSFGPDHPGVAKSLNNLAGLYYQRRQYDGAELLYKRVLEIRERAHGADHPDVAQSLNNLATLYHAQGRHVIAEPLYERSLTIYENALGPDHFEVAAFLLTLAGFRRDQGRFDEAESLFRRSVAIREKAMGPGHPDVATSLTELAGFFRGRQRMEEAEPLYERALAIREQKLVAGHPDLLQSLNNLAILYNGRGQHDDAASMLARALASQEEALGPDHPDVVPSLSNLAGLYQSTGRTAEAAALLERAVTIYETAHGATHPSVARSLNNLAGLYHGQGRSAEAASVLERAVAIYETTLGADHPAVSQSLNNLASLYNAQGKRAKADSLRTRLLQIEGGDAKLDGARDRERR